MQLRGRERRSKKHTRKIASFQSTTLLSQSAHSSSVKTPTTKHPPFAGWRKDRSQRGFVFFFYLYLICCHNNLARRGGVPFSALRTPMSVVSREKKKELGTCS